MPGDQNGVRMSGRLLALIADLMQVQLADLDERSNFETLPTWDSEREVELAFMLEHEYEITVGDDELERLHSVSDVRQLLASRGIADP